MNEMTKVEPVSDHNGVYTHFAVDLLFYYDLADAISNSAPCKSWEIKVKLLVWIEDR